MSKDWTNEEVLSENFIDACANVLKCVRPFVEMINGIIMPDDDSSDSEDEEEGEDAEEAEADEDETED
jgi:hypothetical protein